VEAGGAPEVTRDEDHDGHPGSNKCTPCGVHANVVLAASQSGSTLLVNVVMQQDGVHNHDCHSSNPSQSHHRKPQGCNGRTSSDCSKETEQCSNTESTAGDEDAPQVAEDAEAGERRDDHSR